MGHWETGFKNLEVWKNTKDLAVEIYKITESTAFNKDFDLRSQIRRSSISIPSNIAEGDERGTNNEAVRFLYIAKGSLAELRTQLEIAKDIGYIEKELFEYLENRCVRIGKMLGSLINVRSKCG
ncbi:MAG: four helix bundle protein [Clostridia bacterium]|nr:four helix bundle protein [Clostridia bacterium]